MSHLALLTILLGATEISTQVAGNCLLNFTEQPITFAACLLYDAERIVLMCTISSESEDLLNPDLLDPNGIIIRWYYNNGTESELTVGTNETRREGGNGDPIVISSTLTISPISQHDAVTLAQGSYYCRVQVDKEILRSNSSQQFIVLNIGDYVQYGTSCAERNFIVRDNACAVFSTVETKGSESLPTISYRNNSITDVIMAQEVDTTFVVIQSSSNQSDEIWIYILVAVLTAFFIIIIVLTIFVLRLTLMIRKSQPRSNVDHIYETVNSNDDIGQRNIAMNDNSITGTTNLEVQICRAYEVVQGTVLMESNTAYSAPTNDIEMQTCDAYEADKKSVTMESNIAYVAHR